MQALIIYGIHPILEALEAGKQIEKVFIEDGFKNPRLAELRQVLKERNIPYMVFPGFRFKKLAGNKAHQGIAAAISPVEYQDVEEVVQRAFENGETPLVVVMDKITDVRNFGAIARTAECFGVHALVFPDRGSAPVNEDAIKTSAGALMKIPVCRTPNLKKTLEMLKMQGLSVAAITEHGKTTAAKADLKTPLALLMGSEEKGISDEYLKYCDIQVKIPMTGTIASLNVSVAAGIVLYECVRQRGEE